MSSYPSAIPNPAKLAELETSLMKLEDVKLELAVAKQEKS